MKNVRRYLTQDISLERIQNVFDLGIQDRIATILRKPGYDELKVKKKENLSKRDCIFRFFIIV